MSPGVWLQRKHPRIVNHWRHYGPVYIAFTFLMIAGLVGFSLTRARSVTNSEKIERLQSEQQIRRLNGLRVAQTEYLACRDVIRLRFDEHFSTPEETRIVLAEFKKIFPNNFDAAATLKLIARQNKKAEKHFRNDVIECRSRPFIAREIMIFGLRRFMQFAS